MEDPYNTGRDRASSVLGPTLTFKGELTADEDLLIRGRIEGTIRHSSNLKVGKEGKIAAEVSAKYIEVLGEVRGDLKGESSVVVKQSADVSGNIFSPSVSLHEGAKFNGSIDMSDDAVARAEAPAEAAAKADDETDAPEAGKNADGGSNTGGKKSGSKRAADAA